MLPFAPRLLFCADYYAFPASCKRRVRAVLRVAARREVLRAAKRCAAEVAAAEACAQRRACAWRKVKNAIDVRYTGSFFADSYVLLRYARRCCYKCHHIHRLFHCRQRQIYEKVTISLYYHFHADA